MTAQDVVYRGFIPNYLCPAIGEIVHEGVASVYGKWFLGAYG